jgi:hypothetical protein
MPFIASKQLGPLFRLSLCLLPMFPVSPAVAAVPVDARIPLEFTGVWADQKMACEKPDQWPTFKLAPRGFEGLPGEKAYPKVKKLDRTGRHISVSFYNSNGALGWRSLEYFKLSKDRNALEYRFAGGTLNWVRCSGPMTENPTKSEGPGQPNGF